MSVKRSNRMQLVKNASAESINGNKCYKCNNSDKTIKQNELVVPMRS